MPSLSSILAGLLSGLFLILCSSHCLANSVIAGLGDTKTVAGTVIGSGIDKYTFKIEKEKSFVISVTKTGEHDKDFIPSVKLMDPGKQIFAQETEEFFVRIPVMGATEGEWTVEVGRSDGGKDGGNYKLTLIEAPGAEGIPMKFQKLYKGNITRGAIDVYTIKSVSELMGNLALVPEQGQGFIPEVMVFAPDGALIYGAGCPEYCDIDLPLMVPGVYTIMVWGDSRAAEGGSYSLVASKREEDVFHNPHSVTENIVGEIENENPVGGTVKGNVVDSYTFKVAEGSSFIITLSEKGTHSPGANLFWELFDPENNLFAGGSVEVNAGMRVFNEDVRPGDWRVNVGMDMGGGDGESGREYEIRLFQVPGVKGKKMKFGETYTGNLFRGMADVYTISGTPDVLARIRLTPKEDVKLFPDMTVFAPNGTMANAIGCTERCSMDLEMTEYGDYTVIVSQMESNDAKGSYDLSVERTDGKPEFADVGIDKLFKNPTVPVYPHRLLKMDQSAYIYRNGMFLPFTSRSLTQEDREAAEAGDAIAQLHVGDCSDSREAIQWWEKAAAQGNVTARNRLGIVSVQENANRKYEAALWYRQVTEQGMPDAAFKHANRMVYGCTDAQDFAQNRKLLMEVAEKGVAAAQYNLAVLYAFGFDEEPDFAEAAKWYGKAADQGLIVAMNSLGELYEHGDGVSQNDAKALKLYQQAAKSGYPQAVYNLGRFAAEGRGMPKDTEKAAAWFKQAADEGHVNAQAELYALQGDTTLALQLWYRTALLGNQVSLRRLVETYRKIGVPQPNYQSAVRKFVETYLVNKDAAPVLDYDELLEFYRNASHQINPQVFAGLADLFAKQTPPDYFEAYYWYSLVLDSLPGVNLPAGEKKVLRKYAQEEAAKIAKNLSPEQIAVTKWRIDDRHPAPPSEKLKEAARIFLRAEKAYEENDVSSSLFYLKAALIGLPRAQMQIGAHFAVSLNDTERAMEFYKKAMLGGRVEMASWIGEYYHFGIDVPRDLNKAAEWYELDASRGYKPAIGALGWIYLEGLKNSGKKAVAMYEKAAARDIHEANNALGMIYLYGLGGIPKDRKKALKWYLKSAEKGSPVGAIQAAAILTNHSPYDYGRALKLLSAFGSPVALNNRAYMYEHGLGLEEQEYLEGQPRPTAFELYKKAAGMCYGHAMYNIGRLYATGANAPEISATPIKKDMSVARIWMENAAMHGSMAANMWLDSKGTDIATPTREMRKIVKTVPITELGYPPKPCEEKGRE